MLAASIFIDRTFQTSCWLCLRSLSVIRMECFTEAHCSDGMEVVETRFVVIAPASNLQLGVSGVFLEEEE